MLANQKILSFLILISMLTYGFSWGRKNRPAQQINKTYKVSLQDSIAGNWSLSSESHNGSTIMFNVLPRVQFSADNVTSIIYPGGVVEHPNWRILKPHSIVISKNGLFRDSIYQVLLKTERGLIHLALRNENTKSEYDLSRIK